MIYAGIDPGITGALAFLDHEGWLIEVLDMPVVTRNVNGKNRNSTSAGGLAALLRDYSHQADGKLLVTIEQVNPMPKEGAVGAFSFGRGLGIIEGVCAGVGISYKLVPSPTWKKHFRLLKQPKDTARAVALERFPIAPITLKKHIGRADALLIASWGFIHHD